MKLSKDNLINLARRRFFKPYEKKFLFAMVLAALWLSVFTATIPVNSTIPERIFQIIMAIIPFIGLIIWMAIMKYRGKKYIAKFLEDNKNLIDKEL